MLELYYGTDTTAARGSAIERAEELADACGTTPERIDSEAYEAGMFAEYTARDSLFGGTLVYILDTPSALPEYKKECMDMLHDMADSSHHFIIIEGSLTAAQLRPFQKHTEELHEFTKVADASFNVFSLADALARKDKQALWLGLHNAWSAGVATEQIIGTLWWQLIVLRGAATVRDPAEIGVKPYPFKKAQSALKRFQDGELDEYAQSLLHVQTEAFDGGLELDLGLERWVLTR